MQVLHWTRSKDFVPAPDIDKMPLGQLVEELSKDWDVMVTHLRKVGPIVWVDHKGKRFSSR